MFKGSITLEKSLLDRLLSPTILILNGDLIKRGKISLPTVPEFPAFKIKFFLNLKPLIPLPYKTQFCLDNLILIPSFFKHSIALKTSSDLSCLDGVAGLLVRRAWPRLVCSTL